MSVQRIVPDSNVVISAFLFGGPPARVIGYAVEGAVQCCTSIPIPDEIQGVLLRPKFGLSAGQVLALREEYCHLCEVVQPRERVHAIRADPADNMVLECALAARADAIVSGDAHLLRLETWRGIRILSPTTCVEEWGKPA